MRARTLPSGWVSVTDAARILGVGRVTLYRWRAKRKGPRVYRYGRRPAYRIEELRAYMQQGGQIRDEEKRERQMELDGTVTSFTVSGNIGEVRLTFNTGETTSVSFVLKPSAAIELAEELEEVARPMLLGGVDDFRTVMKYVFGDAEKSGTYI